MVTEAAVGTSRVKAATSRAVPNPAPVVPRVEVRVSTPASAHEPLNTATPLELLLLLLAQLSRTWGDETLSLLFAHRT